LLPVLFVIFSLGGFFDAFAYLRRRRLWGLVLLLTCMGTLDLYSDDLNWANINSEGGRAGGLIGMELNQLIFNHFGRVGATIIFVTCYLISLISLTNLQLTEWVRAQWRRRQEGPEPVSEDVTAEEKALERRAKELEKQARKLQEQVDKAGLGADLQ